MAICPSFSKRSGLSINHVWELVQVPPGQRAIPRGQIAICPYRTIGGRLAPIFVACSKALAILSNSRSPRYLPTI